MYQRSNFHLNLRTEMPEDIVDLILEPAGQHLVGLVQHELLDVVGPNNKEMVAHVEREKN